eukprot:gene28040-31142_t
MRRYLGDDYSSVSSQRRGDVTAANVHNISAKHFPLCMQNLTQQLHSEHHLRHSGRQQLTLFLKSVGLPMEEAIIFWRTEFGPRTPADKFDKEYAYAIRHNYGKEGKRTDYSAHNCLNVIRMAGGHNEHHGCPYRRFDENALRSALSKLNALTKLKCDSGKAEEAVQKAKGGHYQIACACTFEGTHHVSTDVGINHPSQYYAESRKVYDERDGITPATAVKQEGGASAAPPAMASGSMTPVQTRPPTSPSPMQTV